MIADIFCHLAELLKQTDFFNNDRVYEYAELVKVSNQAIVKPMYYKGKQAGYVDVFNWDVNGTCYIRKTGKTTYLRKRAKYKACNSGTLVEIKLPCRLVAVVPKEKTGDERFSDDILLTELIGAIQGSFDSLAAAIQAHSVFVDVTQSDTNTSAIWNSEVTGVPFSESTAYKFSVVSIDFNIILIGDTTCLKTCLSNASS